MTIPSESDRNNALNERIKALEANITRLRNEMELLPTVFYCIGHDEIALSIQGVLDETPAQSLAAIQADAIDKAVNSIVYEDNPAVYEYVGFLIEYANQLREDNAN